VVGGVNGTTDRWWAVSMTPLTSRGRCPFTLPTKYDTAGQLASKFDMLWLILKGISIKNSHIGKLNFTVSTTFLQKILGLTKDHCSFQNRISLQIRSHSKKALTLLRGAQMELFDEKPEVKKSRDRVPLNTS
jgi:hypothetical protein